jgi:protein-S-isoprenylcysteine O-methyltransferase Ste14
VLKLIAFIAISFVLAYISKNPLRVPGSHGFYRFFAWEAILALLLINIVEWFRDPFSACQIISWVLLFSSLFFLISGSQILFTAGKPSRERKDETLFSFEKTTSLVTSGIFKYIRHPLYGSTLFLAWGIFFKNPESLAGAVLNVAATYLLIATAKADERECLRFFGMEYESYMKHSKMFIPFVF